MFFLDLSIGADYRKRIDKAQKSPKKSKIRALSHSGESRNLFISKRYEFRRSPE
jgi:hypothetical protein